MQHMLHRHLNTTEWTLPAIDSCFERGGLPDWRELFAEVRKDRKLAKAVLARAQVSQEPGVALLVSHLVARSWPES